MFFTRSTWWVGLALLGGIYLGRPLTGEEPASVDAKPAEVKTLSLEQARDQAEQLQEVYLETLEVMHDRYFHGERAIVPARAMEDLFEKLEKRTNVKARWISVNAKAMSVRHAPASEFEKLAAKEITSGKEVVEQIDEGVYRRAIAVPLGDGCIHCHILGALASPPKGPHFAGLVFSTPIEKK